MYIKQISVLMENVPGELAGITEILSANGIDIRAVTTADTADYGILRLVVNDPDRAESALRKNGMTTSVSDVIAVAIADDIGSFGRAIGVLKDNNVSVEYMYPFIGENAAKSLVILKTNDLKRSVDLLLEKGIDVIRSGEVYGG